MKPLGYLLARVYADIFRQIPTQLQQYFFTGHIIFAMEIRHLHFSMGAGISSSAAGDLNALA
jgi:hypothetical protein